MGKNFSCNNTGKRRKADFYQTPYSMTEQLLENEKFDYNKSILEPAFGKRAIVNILKKRWNNSIFMMDRFIEGSDFLADSNCLKTDYIITNPPFSLAFEFIQKAKEVATEKFAMLLPLSYLHGQKRYASKIFRDENYPLTKVYVFTRYPLLEENIRDDGKYKTGMMVYAWFIWYNMINNPEIRTDWLKDKIQIPIIDWIDNNKYVLNSKDK